ncbi:MAG: hypothetical protein GF421_07735 [Candidatus Aminicenantes bacterium]|nr:hypothetical protein [Candidatus Aminicenantes bacterium]
MMKKFTAIILVLLTAGLALGEDELPLPAYDNSVIISIEHRVTDSTEVDYIKNNFNFGLYAWLCFSKTGFGISLDWHADLSQADSGIQSFKDSIDSYIQAAINHDVRFHIVVIAGLVRYVDIYSEAKQEDIRNCQWYNDNKLASDSQILDPDAMDSNIWGTLSRYARKMRAHLEAKAQASLSYLKQEMDDNPGVIAAVSGWGEAELNDRRIDHSQSLQDYFCDYSPFAVLEFRDWIQHTGMYADAGGAYAGEGYSEGGAQYQGSSGLTQFNSDFGTSFTSWDLKYFDWNLSDDYDTDPTDSVNPDPNKIPYADYVHGGMMPDSGDSYIAGGFDPPRVMAPGDAFWDLWNLFRETMVHHFILDMAKWVDDAGISCEKWFSHQIAADYLFGTNPDMTELNPRYYTSASPLWTADVQPYASTGATMYDIKFPPDVYPDEFARTTKYGLSAISSMDDNWAIMEYDAETYPMLVEQSPAADILDQYLNVYDYGPHVINFFRWWDDGAHRIKGMNKEEALKDFVEAIRDKARRTDLNYVFEPPDLVSLSGQFNGTSGAVEIDISPNIWDGEDWEWKDWGDFDYFEVHRSTEPGFTPGGSTLAGTTSDYLYEDSSYTPAMVNYYRARALNVNGAGGGYSEEVMIIPSSSDVAALSVSPSTMIFGATQGGDATSPEDAAVINIGDEGTVLNWTAAPSAGWISVSPLSGTGEAIITVSVDHSGLGTGTHSGQVTVSDPGAFNSPQTIQVTLEVYDESSDEAPFGVFDTPEEGATVYGNVPVTGWALDDVEVTRVEIKRAPHPDDSDIDIGPDGLVYIGDAVFVKGSRTDVEASYPDYPKADRAGWGYMMLTNFLPNGGNGEFTLYAIAFDGSGHQKELGTKTITSDNAGSVKPFGTIDTPVQGGVISGADYVNFGWALTPQPNYIPTDGSTIWVWVDGVPLGHPVYNNYRSDIATLFPDYANSDGAVGYYYLDTTAYENGVHNIAWSVEDSAGNLDGIGSRFFEIQNVGASQGNLMRLDISALQNDASGSLRCQIMGMKKGYQNDDETLEAVKKREDSTYEVKIEQLERVEIHFKGGAGQLIGWGDHTDEPLPVGSTLDKEKGIFYWNPGPGFLGQYVLHFAVTDGQFRSRAQEIVVHIVPKTYGLNEKIRK